jgi:hypothetical protein
MTEVMVMSKGEGGKPSKADVLLSSNNGSARLDIAQSAYGRNGGLSELNLTHGNGHSLVPPVMLADGRSGEGDPRPANTLPDLRFHREAEKPVRSVPDPKPGLPLPDVYLHAKGDPRGTERHDPVDPRFGEAESGDRLAPRKKHGIEGVNDRA